MPKKSTTIIQSFSEIKNPELNLFGGKALHLINMYQKNICIPTSYVIPTQVHEHYLLNGHVSKKLISDIIKIKQSFGGNIIIRSSATCEDGNILSMAGVFLSEYVTHDEQVEQAIYRIYEQAYSKDVEEYLLLHKKSKSNIRMALLVQELIDPIVSGVVYTGINVDHFLIQYVKGLAADLVDGKTLGSALLVNKDGTVVESRCYDINPFPRKLIPKLIKSVKKVQKIFPKYNQDIEFACTKNKVYILQARTLTSNLEHISISQSPQESLEETKTCIHNWIQKEKQEMGTKTAVFSDSNYSELLPKPAPMDIGIYQYISGGSDGKYGATQIGRKEMGYLVDKEAIGIIHYLGGRTYFSLARNAAIYHIGFPDTKKEYFKTLVNEYLDIVVQNPSKAAYPQMGLYLQDPTIEDLEKRFGKKAKRYYSVYEEFVKRMNRLASTFLSDFHKKDLPEINEFVKVQSSKDVYLLTPTQLANYILFLLEHIRTKTYVDFVKAARLGFYYSQRLREMFSDEIYSTLNQGLDGSEITDSNISIANARTEKDAIDVAKKLIGHFSTGEMLEIRHQILRDDPEKLLSYVRGIRSSKQYVKKILMQKKKRVEAQNNILQKYVGKERDEISHIIQSSQKYMALRETVKYLFTKEYALIKDCLETLSEKTQIDSEYIYYLYPRELPLYARQPEQFLHLMRARKQFFLNAEQFDLPSVIRENDVESLSIKSCGVNDFETFSGTFLADGSSFEGIVINADEYKDLKDALAKIHEYKKQNKKIILVAKQMNLSHDPLIIHADGLIIENAGIVAHGAQRARELGKGALAGIPTKILPTGLTVIFDMKNKFIRKA